MKRQTLDYGNPLYGRRTAQIKLKQIPYFLLQKEASEIGRYFSLIKAIAMGNRKLSEIATNIEVKQTSLTKYLRTLIDLDLMEREVPVTESNPEKSKSGLYKIKDNFIAFWFKFVYPYRAYLEKGERNLFYCKLKKDLSKTMRHMFMKMRAEKGCGNT